MLQTLSAFHLDYVAGELQNKADLLMAQGGELARAPIVFPLTHVNYISFQ